jgi:hypothetical protein
MRRFAIAAALLSVLVVAPVAHAANDPLGSGTAKLVLDKGFASFLKHDGITLSATQGAKRKGSSFIWPVIGGSLDPVAGRGEIDAEGSLVFASSGKKLPLRDIAVKTTHSPLVAKVGGSQLKIATSAKLSDKRSGFGIQFNAKALKLTAKVATRLNKKLRPKVPFSEGQPLGSILATPQPKLATVLDTGRATLVFDSAFLAKLESRFVSLNPIFPAEHVGGSFSFPITLGGQIAPSGSEGRCAPAARSNCCSWEPARSSGKSCGWTWAPRSTQPKSTSSRPRPSPASWGGSASLTSSEGRSPRTPKHGRSPSPAGR